MNEEYIKKEDAIAVIDRCRERLQFNVSTYEFLIVMIDDIPPADVIQPIRCGECRNRGNPGCPATFPLKDNGFCSYGERK